MLPFKFENGDEVTDTITGFTGIVMYRVDNLTGCNNYGVQPMMKGVEAKSTMGETKLIDETRLKATGKKVSLPGEKPVAKVKERGPVLRDAIPTCTIK